jgi:hypothetical protein
MANFYIVPPRLIVGSLVANNAVTTLNGFRGDVSIQADSPITLLKQFNNIILGFDSTGFITTAGGTITGNLQFNVSNSTTYGVQLLSKTTDPTGTPPTGAIYFNSASNEVRIYYAGGWNTLTGDGGSGITSGYADLNYLRLDGTNQPVTGYVQFNEYLRFSNKAGVQSSFGSSYGSVYYDTTANKLRVFTPTGWQLVGGGGVTGIYPGTGITVTGGLIDEVGTVYVDESYNFNWTGSNTFTQAITFASAQTFDITKLSITSQTAGDTLYYNGAAWDRLGIGNTGEVLTVSTGATKPEWAPSAASGLLGTPTDSTYTDGYFDTWTPGVTTAADAFDDINELLALLAPAAPDGLGSTTLSISSSPTFYSAKVSANNSANWYQAGITTGSLLNNKYYVSGTLTLASFPTSKFFAGKAGDTASFGTISHILYDSTYTAGTAVSFIDLTTNPTPTYTLGTMRVTALGTTNTIWNKANANIQAYTQSTDGYAGNALRWTPSSIGSSSETIKYEVWKDTYSVGGAATPSFSTAPANTVTTEVFKYLSGLKYYDTGTSWQVTFVAASGIFNRCYNSTRVANIQATGLVTLNLTGEESGTPVYNATYDRSGLNYVTATLNTINESSFNKFLTVGLYKVINSTSLTTNINYYINTYGNISTAYNEYFHDEVYRLLNDSAGAGTAFSSADNLANNYAQVRSGTLRVPLQAEYDSQWAGSANDYSSDTYFEYQRWFSKVLTTQSGTLNFSGVTVSNLYPYGSSGAGNTGINVLIYFESQNVWFDLAVPFNTSGRDGSTKSLAFGAQNVGLTSGSTFAWSSGSLYSTGLNNNRFRLSVIFRGNSTNIITQILST